MAGDDFPNPIPMIPVFGRIGFGRDEIYPDVWINMKMMSMVYCWLV
jgi:hypothetical protein